MADISIVGASGFYTITGETDAGERWIRDNVRGAVTGIAYGDDRRMTQDIADGALQADLTVTLDGVDYVGADAPA